MSIERQSARKLSVIKVKERRMHYVERGKGQPVVFVHGGLGDYRSWRFQIDAVAQRYRVISYSRRYAYPNEWIGDGMDNTISDNADDLAVLINKLELTPVHLVGHSYGAFTAVFLVFHHPQIVRSLVLGEPPVLSLLMKNPEDVRLVEELQKRVFRLTEEAFSRGEPEKAMRIFVDGVIGIEGVFDKLPALARSIITDNMKSLRGELERGLVPFTCEDAQRISAPTLLLKGELSPEFLHRIIDILAECMPNNEQTTILGVSHDLGRMMKPEMFNEKILEFLSKHS